MGETQPGIAPLHFTTHHFLRARKKWQTESECTQTQSTPSLAEAHYSHGVTTSGDTPAIAGCMEFPCQPCEDTTSLRSQSGSPSVLPAVHMAGRIPRTHISGHLAV
ncbi:hypothetical protein TcCL_Unassigned05166 [Trypanosoma cruzi]|nr:hypothetical protein TcCL_Unassigned05166 [Trypanosoma cruzi]